MAVIDKRKRNRSLMNAPEQTKQPEQVLDQPGQGGEEMGGEESGTEVAAAHGPAHEVHITHDHEGGAHHVHSVHPDGHEHHSDHGSAGEAHDHAKELADDGQGEPDGDEQPMDEGEEY